MKLPAMIQPSAIMRPPISQQGNKVKLIPFMFSHIKWQGQGVYYEPFCGTCIVGLNLRPKHAVFSDTNPHIIQFYSDLITEKLDLKALGEFLFDAKRKLSCDSSFYYECRDRFNASPTTPLFLFLNLTCFKNLMRFNKKGEFNAPFQYDSKRYLTNVADLSGDFIYEYLQKLTDLRILINNEDYTFVCSDFRKILPLVKKGDFLYADPPYNLRFATYFDTFPPELLEKLAQWTKTAECGWAISNWYSDKTRVNHLISQFSDAEIFLSSHNYTIGYNKNAIAKEMDVKECLIVAKNHAYTPTLERFIRAAKKKGEN